MRKLFDSIFSDGTQSTIPVGGFLLAIGISLLVGGLYLLAYSYKCKSSKSFKMSLALLPAVVCVVIMMVNGNVGIGVAIAGAFSLVRFRSAQGSAKEICVIFMTMCSGLIAGVGYLAYAILFTIIMCLLIGVSNYIFLKSSITNKDRVLKITIPEDLDYEEVFVAIFERCTIFNELTTVKTTNMGSLYKLTYNVTLKKDISEKDFIDNLRIRNGNLEILLLKQEQNEKEL